MSVRAYRLIRIETEEESTFNFEHDDELMRLLSWRVTDQLDPKTGIGFVTLDLLSLQTALTAATQDETKQILRRMIAQATADGYVEYWCG